jgi:hypothetical protein
VDWDVFFASCCDFSWVGVYFCSVQIEFMTVQVGLYLNRILINSGLRHVGIFLKKINLNSYKTRRKKDQVCTSFTLVKADSNPDQDLPVFSIQ